jgi:hypothetical protein
MSKKQTVKWSSEGSNYCMTHEKKGEELVIHEFSRWTESRKIQEIMSWNKRGEMKINKVLLMPR